MGGMREKDQADFDLERFIDMFDEALTSRDERVINALRSLMMMTILTKSEKTHNDMVGDRNHGPLRRMYEDLRHINSRLSNLEEHIRQEAAFKEERNRVYSRDQWYEDQEKYKLEAARVPPLAGINKKEYDRIAKLINSPSQLAKKEI